MERLEMGNEKVFDEIERKKNEIKVQDGKIQSGKAIITIYEARENELKKELNMWKKKYDAIDNSMKNIRQEYERVNNSYSYKIGRAWVPRKLRKMVHNVWGGDLTS